MTKTISEACGYIAELNSRPLPSTVEVFVIPAHTALASVRSQLDPGSGIRLGAQNAHWGQEGAGTGEMSMHMVKDAGAEIVEIGHSERRTDHGETDQTVALKAAAALENGLIPLICVGEPARVRAAGEQEEFVAAQVLAALARVDPTQVNQCLVAYEPVWSIGFNGTPATRAEIADVISAMHATISSLSSEGCRGLLYGGGVNLDNAADLFSTPHVDGLFVGRAAWSANGLRSLVELVARENHRP